MVDNVRQARVTELPAQPDSGTVYFVKPTEADRGEVFVTGSDAQPVPFGVALASADEQEAGTRDDVAATPAGVQAKVEGEAAARAQEAEAIRASISNVDNTSDADKPVSTAQAAAIGAVAAGITGGSLTPGVWVKLPAIYRLLLGGSGTVTIDVRDAAGAVATGAQVFTVTGAGFASPAAYFGDNAKDVRATSTGTATAEIV